ncbi:MAG: DNA recombination protein RmuC [Pseudolabrys sp.]|nr:DNA recombination protein RmuC [Pseudolabrys sp.]MDP2298373.1 DNA recombination protein RmuC [Pseudolabrys sp.]
MLQNLNIQDLTLNDLMLPQNLPLVIGLAIGLLLIIGLVTVIALLMRKPEPVADPEADQRLRELNARLDAMGSWLQNSHTQLQHTVNTRLDAVSLNLGESMKTSTKNTTDHLQQLHMRLAVIDNAQKNITDLAGTVTSLQNVLSNKQSRGAFGQGQLEAIVADVLPKGAYEFQYTLSNRTKPDCVVFMPDSGPLVIDAKFPLEAMTALRAAQTDDERKFAVARVKQDIAKHVTDISDKYLIPGETQDIALMFIPSESVYADLHEQFDDVVQKAQRARVMIVSPTLMVMAIQVIKQVRKDAEMREAADQIRTEVGFMMKDVTLLSDRVRKLQNHLNQTNTDIDAILISTGKIEKRGGRIEALEFDADLPASADIIAAPVRKLGAAE